MLISWGSHDTHITIKAAPHLNSYCAWLLAGGTITQVLQDADQLGQP
jgi:hypothetical protein